MVLSTSCLFFWPAVNPGTQCCPWIPSAAHNVPYYFLRNAAGSVTPTHNAGTRRFWVSLGGTKQLLILMKWMPREYYPGCLELPEVLPRIHLSIVLWGPFWSYWDLVALLVSSDSWVSASFPKRTEFVLDVCGLSAGFCSCYPHGGSACSVWCRDPLLFLPDTWASCVVCRVCLYCKTNHLCDDFLVIWSTSLLFSVW